MANSLRMVNCTSLDDVRIEVVGEARAITIPAAKVVALWDIVRHMLTDDDFDFSWWDSIDDETGEHSFECTAGSCRGAGRTPLDALENLRDNLKR